MNDNPAPFDRAAHRRFTERARLAGKFADFLIDAAVSDVAMRLSAVTREFKRAADLTAHHGQMARALENFLSIGEIVICGRSSQLLPEDRASPLVVCDDEALPFAPESLDLVTSILGLQWVNDLPGTLIQIRKALRPDGLFIAALVGGESLTELRQALLAAEAEITGGAHLRVSPFVALREMGGLLQRSGFALPVADVETLTVRYANPGRLLDDLRAMGFQNALHARSRNFLRRDVLTRAMEIYAERFTDPDGRVRARFDILHVSGWAPHESQQKPLKPGSAKMRLADALGTREHDAGEKAGS
ncbi:MAG: methyltransferase domain-containing protein [Pseudomonadota bacterium]